MVKYRVSDYIEIRIIKQEGLSDRYSVKKRLRLFQKLHQPAVLSSVHQVQRLHIQVPDAFFLSVPDRVFRSINIQTVALHQFFADETAGKASSHSAVRMPFFYTFFNSADGFLAGIRERSAKTHRKQ